MPGFGPTTAEDEGWVTGVCGTPPAGGRDDTDCACAARAVPASNPTLNKVDLKMLDISGTSNSLHLSVEMMSTASLAFK